MPAPTDRNSRIALAKGWSYHDDARIVNPNGVAVSLNPYGHQWTHWRNPQGYWCTRLDYVGTLEGMAGLMRELNGPDGCVLWTYNIYRHRFECIIDDGVLAFSLDEHPGDCVGDAWLSMMGKEERDASTE